GVRRVRRPAAAGVRRGDVQVGVGRRAGCRRRGRRGRSRGGWGLLLSRRAGRGQHVRDLPQVREGAGEFSVCRGRVLVRGRQLRGAVGVVR
ncbi:unnamed protein product, partial [Prorocentrum cordatum]